LAFISRLDDDHGNTLKAYKAMGSPQYPTEQQVDELNRTTQLPQPVAQRLEGNQLDLDLQVNALVLVEIK
jgi:xylan 1,4-beta-xylosidase